MEQEIEATTDEKTEIPTSDAPDLWGIDPDAVYEWTPKAGRIKLTPGKWNRESLEWDEMPTYGDPLPGAPVFFFAPLLEGVAAKLNVATNRFNIARFKALKAVSAGEPGSEQLEAVDKVIEDVYTPELISEVLRACLVGWKNVKSKDGKPIEFKGVWRKDEIVLRRWAAEAFRAIVDETLFARVSDSFTSAQDSPPA